MLQLQEKIKAVQNKYEEGDQDSSIDCDISDKDKVQFHSMQRWHENVHMTDEDWICLFDQVKYKLQIEGFRLKVSPPREILSMINSKLELKSLTERLVVSDLFSEKYMAHIKDFFEEMLYIKNTQEEFSELNIMQGWKPEEVSLYDRTYLPLAVFLTYKQRHIDDKDKDLFRDCFTIGAGSKRFDLFPEVNPYCHKCAAENMVGRNKKIFKMQVTNKFSLPSYFEDSEDSEDDSKDSQAVDDDMVEGKKVFNPFLLESSSDERSVDSDENGKSGGFNDDIDEVRTTVLNPLLLDSPVEESEILKTKPFKCPLCIKSFSKEKFIQLHQRIFHGMKKQIVVPEFGEPVDMMTTFCIEDIANEEIKKTNKNNKNQKKTLKEQNKSSKEQQRKSSKEQQVMSSKKQQMKSSKEQQVMSSKEQQMKRSKEQQKMSSKEQQKKTSSKEQQETVSKVQQKTCKRKTSLPESDKVRVRKSLRFDKA